MTVIREDAKTDPKVWAYFERYASIKRMTEETQRLQLAFVGIAAFGVALNLGGVSKATIAVAPVEIELGGSLVFNIILWFVAAYLAYAVRQQERLASAYYENLDLYFTEQVDPPSAYAQETLNFIAWRGSSDHASMKTALKLEARVSSLTLPVSILFIFAVSFLAPLLPAPDPLPAQAAAPSGD
ncbi:MAG: hypothetical protein AAGF60_00190 [Pseudomonadota bacterium]